MMPVFEQRIAHALAQRKAQQLMRKRWEVTHLPQAQLRYQDRQYVNFSSNDYLGLSSEPSLMQAWQEGIKRYGVGSSASPLVTGFTQAHHQLEQALAQWLGFERALLFNSGFSANQAVLFSLLHEGDHLVQDKRNHASLMEAGLLSPAYLQRFRHNDVAHLQQILTAKNTPQLVVTEGVFSMDGDQAPLAQIHSVCSKQQAWLMVDDAHGIGVLSQGLGSCHQADIQPDILVITFGKAFGISGAAVLCRAEVAEYLIQFARHYVYSTAMPAAQAHALMHALHLVQTQQWRREKLMELAQEYQDQLSHLAEYVETNTPIKPVIIGKSSQALDLADQLKQAGFWVTAIRPPTVAPNAARLRITLTTNHSLHQVRALAEQIKRFIE